MGRIMQKKPPENSGGFDFLFWFLDSILYKRLLIYGLMVD
jgi:hypothetical protein